MLKNACSLYLVIVFAGTWLRVTHARELVKFYEITEKVQQSAARELPQKKYVNVFTNHPQVGEVLRSAYEETRRNASGVPLSALRVKTTFADLETSPKARTHEGGAHAKAQEAVARPRVAKSLHAKLNGTFAATKTTLAVPKGSLKGMQDLQETLPWSQEKTPPAAFDTNGLNNDWVPLNAKSDLGRDSSYEDVVDYYATSQENTSAERSTRFPRASSERPTQPPHEDDVQSEHGDIVPQDNPTSAMDASGSRGLSDWIQKIPKTFLSSGENATYVGGVAKRVHHLLKSYMPKLYQTKYHGDEEDVHEAKKVEGGAKKNKFVDHIFPNSFLSLFTIVQFPNSQCLASSGLGDYDGVCYHPSECADLHGTAMGKCANGYGVCCACKYT